MGMRLIWLESIGHFKASLFGFLLFAPIQVLCCPSVYHHQWCSEKVPHQIHHVPGIHKLQTMGQKEKENLLFAITPLWVRYQRRIRQMEKWRGTCLNLNRRLNSSISQTKKRKWGWMVGIPTSQGNRNWDLKKIRNTKSKTSKEQQTNQVFSEAAA